MKRDVAGKTKSDGQRRKKRGGRGRGGSRIPPSSLSQEFSSQSTSGSLRPGGVPTSVSHYSRDQPLSLARGLLVQNTQTWANRFVRTGNLSKRNKQDTSLGSEEEGSPRLPICLQPVEASTMFYTVYREREATDVPPPYLHSERHPEAGEGGQRATLKGPACCSQSLTP